MKFFITLLVLFAAAFAQITTVERGSGTSADPFVFTQVNRTAEAVNYATIRVVLLGNNRVNLDALLFGVGFEADDNGDRSANFVMGYAFEPDYLIVDENNMDMGDMFENMRDMFTFQFYGIAYDNLIEYEYDGDGLQCNQIGNMLDCQDIGLIRQLVPLDNFVTPIPFETLSGPNPFQEIYVANMTTTDGVFSASCRTSNQEFTYQGRTVSPFEMKCDVFVRNYTYLSTNNSLALNTFVLAGEVMTDFNTSEAGEFQFGEGAGSGFFVFNNTITPADDMNTNLGSIFVQDVVLSNEVFDFQPDAVVRTTIFSFLAPQANNFLWDPTVGVQPGDVSSASAISVGIFSLLALFFSLF